MSSTMWYLTRGSGVVATALMIAALVNGVLFSARETGKRLRPAWWLDLHNGLGGYALIFTGIHLVTAYADADLGVSIASVVVPGAAKTSTTAFTWGVLAFYGLVVTVFTSWPRKIGGRRLWHLLHLLSVPATVLAGVHAYQLGSDGKTTLLKVLFIVGTAAGVYVLVLRITEVVRKRNVVA
jgi:methionine sulfoxide reductase heme-binding subunit